MNERRLVTSRTDEGLRLKALVDGGLTVVEHGGVLEEAGSRLASITDEVGLDTIK